MWMLWWLVLMITCVFAVDIRCRSCGAYVTDSDHYSKTHDTSRAISSELDESLGGQLNSFENPLGIEFQLATFKDADADVALSDFDQHSFFTDYSWRIIYCSRCKTQLGFYYLHSDIEKCQKEEKNPTQDVISNTPSIIQSVLQDKCLILPSGWWTYKYCFQDKVVQFHEEKDGVRTSEWSMGAFKEELMENSVDTNGNKITLIRHLHTGGQHCDENGQLRSTETHFVCCKEMDKSLHISGLQEPELCTYIMTVCVPQLCAGYSAKELPNINPHISAEKQNYCRSAFTNKNIPAEFFGIIWPNVLMEGTEDVAWIKELKTSTSL